MLAFFGAIVDIGESQSIRTVNQQIGIFEQATRPGNGAKYFIRMNMRILVAIDQIERAGVEFYPARRTAQCNPQLLIQFLQRQQIRAVIDLHLVESARAKKIPCV